MTPKQKQILLEAWDYCDEEDKSTEFMLQYMSDSSGLSYDRVVEYVCSDQSTKDRDDSYKKLG